MKPIEARRFGEVSVAVNDIVEKELSQAYKENALYKYLGSKRKITGRIVSFEENCIVLDVSAAYQSKQVDICYDRIVDIKDVTKEELFP